MNRKVAAVLACTFLAMVGATVWVPVEEVTIGRPTGRPFLQHTDDSHERPDYWWIWAIGDGPIGRPIRGIRVGTDLVIPGTTRVWRIRWGRLALTQSVLIALGGLLALVLRTRAARRGA